MRNAWIFITFAVLTTATPPQSYTYNPKSIVEDVIGIQKAIENNTEKNRCRLWKEYGTGDYDIEIVIGTKSIQISVFKKLGLFSFKIKNGEGPFLKKDSVEMVIIGSNGIIEFANSTKKGISISDKISGRSDKKYFYELTYETLRSIKNFFYGAGNAAPAKV